MNTTHSPQQPIIELEEDEIYADTPRLAAVREQLLAAILSVVQKLVLFVAVAYLLMLFIPGAPRITIAFIIGLAAVEYVLILMVQSLARNNQSELALRRFILYSLVVVFLISLLLQNLHVLVVVCAIFIILTLLLVKRSFVWFVAIFAVVLYIATWVVLPVLIKYMAPFEQISADIFLGMDIVVVVAAFIILLVCVYTIGQQLRQVVADVQGLVLTSEQLRTIEQASAQQLSDKLEEQQRLLNVVQTLEVPTIPLREGMIVVPLLSYLDTRRMESIERRVLAAVEEHGSRIVILEMTGVPTIDTYACNRLIQLARAIRLLGSHAIMTGLHPDIAIVLSRLAIDLKEIDTFASIQDVLRTYADG